MNTAVKLTVNTKSHAYARIYASLLSDEYQRKRAYASLSALYALIDLIETSSYDVQKAMTLYKNPMINEQYEISDFYVNNWHIDVRIITGGEAVLIPKIHYDCNIVPDFYAAVKVDSSLQSAELIGFADTSEAEKEAFDYHYCSISCSSLIDYDEFLARVKNEKRINLSNADHELFKKSYLGLMDNEIDIHTKNQLIKHLLECSDCRMEFCCFTGFEMVSSNASQYPELLHDGTLNIIGAQAADDKKYEGKEQIIYIGGEKDEKQENPQKKKRKNSKNDKQKSPSDDATEKPISTETETDYNEQEKQVNETSEKADNQESGSVPADDDFLEDLFFGDEDTENTEETAKTQVFDDEKNNGGTAAVSSAAAENTKDKQNDADLTPEADNQLIENIDETGFSKETETQNMESLIDNSEILEEKEDFPQEYAPSEIQNSQDMELLIEDDGGEEILAEKGDMEIIEEDEASEPEISQITDENDLISEDDKDSVLIEEDTIIEANEDLLKDDDSEIVLIEDEQTPDEDFYTEADNASLSEEKSNIQKVIVDYDEYGEPIYSYITGINQDGDEISEIETIADEEKEFEEYKDTESIAEDSIDNYVYTPYIQSENYEEELSPSAVSSKPVEKIYEANEDAAPNETPLEENILEDYENAPIINGEKESDIQTSLKPGEEISDDNVPKSETEAEKSPSENEISKEENIIQQPNIKEQTDEQNNEEYEQFEEYEENENDDEKGEYDDYDLEDNLPEENVKKSSNKAAMIIISAVALLVLLGGGAFFFIKHSKSGDNIASNQILPPENSAGQDTIELPPHDNLNGGNDLFEDNIAPAPENAGSAEENAEPRESGMPERGTIYTSNMSEADLTKPAETGGDVNKVMANAFSTGMNSVSLKELNWFCTTELFSDKAFKNYLQNLDNVLKQNLKNNLLNAVEMPPENSAAAKFAVDNNGNLQKVIISNSSGSDEIDNILLQSINESFEGEKSQILSGGTLKSDMYYLKVVIKL